MDAKLVSLAGLIPSADAMQGLVGMLDANGFQHEQFGMLAADEHYEGFLELAGDSENEGTIESAIIGGLAYLGAVTGLGVTLFSGGGLGLALVALAGAGGAGTLSGLLAAAGFHRAHSEKIAAELGRRSSLAWIAPQNPAQASIARELLTSAGAAEVIVCEPVEAS